MVFIAVILLQISAAFVGGWVMHRYHYPRREVVLLAGLPMTIIIVVVAAYVFVSAPVGSEDGLQAKHAEFRQATALASALAAVVLYLISVIVAAAIAPRSSASQPKKLKDVFE